MADIVVYEDSPLAQYLQEIQGEQHGSDLQHTAVPVHDPEPPPEFIGFRLAHNAVDMLAHLVEYLTHTFSPPASDTEDAEFEERFKYFICTSPFLNRTATVHTHERSRRNDVPMTVEYASKFNPGRFGYALGFGTLATLVARSVLARTRAGRLPWLRPLLSRPAAVSLTLATSAWMLRILQRRNIQTTQNQALRSLQLLVNHCQSLDAKVNRAIMVIQEIELVSRGYRLSMPLAPISRIEQASKTRRCNMVRAQLVAALAKSGALFQRSTETLQSHIDHKRLSTLLDMYNITPSPRPASPPGEHDVDGPTTPRATQERCPALQPSDSNISATELDNLTLIASPTSDTYSPLPSTFSNHIRQRSSSRRRSRTLTGTSQQNSRPNSFHEVNHHHGQGHVTLMGTAEHVVAHSRRTTRRRYRTSWSASEGDDDSDNGTASYNISPRSSTYSTIDERLSPTLLNSPEMTSLERLRKNFQRMHGHRREFLCELLSIRRKSRQGRHGLNALKDYDQNWTVVRDVLQEGVAGIESVVDELNTLPRIDTQGNRSENSEQDRQLRPFMHRLALLEQHVRGIQAKLFICNEDIKETIKQEPVDAEQRRLLELQYDSISQDIGMMATEWQLGKSALINVFEPSLVRSMLEERERESLLLQTHEKGGHGSNEDDLGALGAGEHIMDSMEPLEDTQRLMFLASKREETWEASTESDLGGSTSRRAGILLGPTGERMTRAERIQHQKLMREQEELKKERTYDSSKMVHELKDVLGRRRHLREHEDNEENEPQQQQQQQQQTQVAPSLLPFSIVAGQSFIPTAATGPAHSYSSSLERVDEGLQLSLDQGLSMSASSRLSQERVSSFSVDAPSSVFERLTDYTRTLGDELADQEGSSFIEISGVGEAEEEEEEQ
ncbi:hypothetical protein EDD11_003037 [Mortierella claussenii]|nr:hypothetical protein EDD11_003037 [Mortierella claussenii]